MREKEIAKILLSIKAVSLNPENPYTWSSGMKSPIYCDNRLIMSSPEERKTVIEIFTSYIKEHFSEVEVVAGTATAGIPHAAWIADHLGIPMIYVRSSSKGHGKQNRIEGKLETGKKVLVIEDLISTGGSSIEAAESVKEAGGSILGICSIFTYELAAAKAAEQEAGYPLKSLTTYSTLIDVAAENNMITEKDLYLLQEWQKNPKTWSSK
ncbi:orotate phosphoribosyltransferase [Salipaludibacillus neizhouensis]|uniref:orotate phosphoribosyltransferase n=1 Tax=Salipaludibacillus neizhouensis TaxID=885475 RepID=UPI000EAA8CEC|nr:orotate phosphoribosyltransferase [Salipaludibacillus neizhouensis]